MSGPARLRVSGSSDFSTQRAPEPRGSNMQMQRQNRRAAQEQPLVRFGLGLANWSERWFPDPLIFALLGIVVVFVVGLLLHQSPNTLAIQGGKNFWSLVNFTMQMVMIIIGGYVVASTPIVYRAIRALAGVPKTPRGAIALVALFSMLTSLISWGLSLIFSGLFVRELANRVKGMDYRAAGAAAYLGLGAVWAMDCRLRPRCLWRPRQRCHHPYSTSAV